MNALVAGVRSLGIDLAPAFQAAFQTYYRLLDERGRDVNLTSVHGWEAVRDELFLRSMRVLAITADPVPEIVRTRGEGASVVDVGTGAGVPGLVLKLVLPELSLTLLDATRKKTDFLGELVHATNLRDVRIVNERAEDAARRSGLRERFDLVTARSVAALPELAELTLPFCRIGGLVVAPKGRDADEEIAAAGFAARELGATGVEVSKVGIPGPAAPDSMVVMRKERHTSDRYPRRAGMPHKSPLIDSNMSGDASESTAHGRRATAK